MHEQIALDAIQAQAAVLVPVSEADASALVLVKRSLGDEYGLDRAQGVFLLLVRLWRRHGNSIRVLRSQLEFQIQRLIAPKADEAGGYLLINILQSISFQRSD